VIISKYLKTHSNKVTVLLLRRFLPCHSSKELSPLCTCHHIIGSLSTNSSSPYALSHREV
jgi:hypothetical protein